MITLTLQVGSAPAKVFPFGKHDTVAIGRNAGNDLEIADGRISGRHGHLVRREAAWFYRDLRSTNGSLLLHDQTRTVVDGESTKEVVVADGDTLLLGDVDDPVVLHVAIREPEPGLGRSEGTVVARRAMERGAELSQVLFGAQGGAEAAKLVDLLRRVGGQEDAGVVFHHVARFLLDRLPAGQGIVLVGAEQDEATLMLRRGDETPSPVETDPPPYPRGLVGQATEAGQAMLSTDDSALASEDSLARFGAAAAMVIPLGQGNQRFGTLVVVGGGRGFAERDLDVAVALAFQVSNCFATARLVRRLRGVERRLRDENRYLKAQVERDDTFSDIIGSSPAIRSVFEQMRLVIDTDATVLVTGETGTGKELVARALHNKSKRKHRLFAAVNCAALSENLLESELFGHVKGAFTGAHENKKGLFTVAHGGTLFLDEIGELSQKLQAKLLRVLQEGEVTPVGSTRPIPIDVRILCATHRDLRAEVRGGTFREDLFYRINVFPIRLPPLRERGDDVPALGQFFIERYARQFRKTIPGMTEAAAARLKAHPFPGNIRELENEIQRAVLLTPDNSPIDAAVLSEDVRGAATASAASVSRTGSLKETMVTLEKQVLRQALDENGWNRSATARILGISRQALMAKLAKYQLAPD